MSLTVIILIVIGVIAIIVSYSLTSNEIKDAVNPNVKTELTDADKKHLDKLVDTHMNEYSKKKVKETVAQNVKTLIADHAKEIDEHATEDTQKLEQYYNEVTADINSNKAELEDLLKKVNDKEKDFKKSLTVVDEYKEGLNKLKEELKSMEESIDAKKAEIDNLLKYVNNAQEQAAAQAKIATDAAAAAAQAQAAASQVQAQVPVAAPTDASASEGQTEVLRGPVMDASELEDNKNTKKFGKKNKKNKKGKKAEPQNTDDGFVEAQPVQPEQPSQLPPSQPANVETPELDDMLTAEGINLTEGDTVGNVMEMFNAGFSIIEISKVLGIGVGEVKAVIDKQQGE